MTVYFLAGLTVMAGVTYLTRALPFVLVRRPIESPFIHSFLYYMPYAVLGAMTFPAILYATATPVSAAAGMVVALVLSYWGRKLLPVAVAATAAVCLAEWLWHIHG